MKLKWSVYFQSPDFLERTRMMLIEPEYEPLICKWCGLKDGMRVLDVGCGTGFFTRLLKRGNPKADLVGLDSEDLFIQRARREAEKAGLVIDFLEGDGLSLPFVEGSFDLVVSHTFLSSVADPVAALSEMKRVLRPGGRIASVTAMSFLPQGMHSGHYPKELAWGEELNRLANEIWTSFNRLAPMSEYTCRIRLSEWPAFFADQGLKNVSVYPLGKFFSLSNAAVHREKKLQWLELYQRSEEGKLDAFMTHPEGRKLIAAEKAERYRTLLREKCEYYRSHPEENSIWEWQGGANILITGDL